MLNRQDVEDPWLFERCREVQRNPNNHLDLWAREHYKSTIITFAKTIQDILATHGEEALSDREVTFGLFSFNRPTAKGFLRQIKYELETNSLLKGIFNDVLWQDPEKEAPTWSLDDGLVVKRKGNPKEPTIGAHGLVDSMPTGKHYVGRIYDDVITEKWARSPEMIQKATDAWELSLSLGSRGGFARYIGTRYHYNDPYRVIMSRGVAKPRIHQVIDNTGQPVFFNKEEMEERRKGHGPYIWACQYMQDPKSDEAQGFKKDWIEFHTGSDGEGMNRYILVDPASEKKKTSDYTSMWVIGLGQDKNYYILDIMRDRLNLTERANALFRLHRKWHPNKVGYEKYGMQADIEHIKDRMSRENYHFAIEELGGSMPKLDRIRRLIPLFEQHKVYLPQSKFYTNYEGKTVDLIEQFIEEEYDAFPVSVHDDMLDAMARILDEDMGTTWPIAVEAEDRYSRKQRRKGTAWSA